MKVSKMKIFELLRFYMQLLGIWQRNSRFGWILSIAASFVYLALSFITLFSSLGFFLSTAQAFSEYVESFYYILHSSLLLSWYLIYLAQRDKYATLIDELETLIQKREISFSQKLKLK